VSQVQALCPSVAALDAGLLAAALAVEHYEVSRYGTLKSWAHQTEQERIGRACGSDARGREES